MGAARKYLLYAIGEILLVMVGILLALQINNWNEWRKDRIKEQNVLGEIGEALQENLLTLEDAILHMKQLNESSIIVLNFLEDSLAYSDTLSFHFDRAKWSSSYLVEGLSRAGYIGLSNIGYDILRNAELRKKVIKYFDKDMPILISSFKIIKEGTYANYDEFLRREFKDLGGPYALPLYPDQIQKDNYYRSIIITIYDHRISTIRDTEEYYELTLQLLQFIRDELGD